MVDDETQSTFETHGEKNAMIEWRDETPEQPQLIRSCRILKINEQVDLRVSERYGKRFKHMLGSICIASDESTADCEKYWPIEAAALLRQWADDIERGIAEEQLESGVEADGIPLSMLKDV